MQSRIKKIGKVARPSVSSLKLLVKFKLIEILPEHEVYRKKSNVGEPEWKLDTDGFKAYKATESGKIADIDPYHLIFLIWAQTQHYADFDVQVRAVLGHDDPYPKAAEFLDHVLRRTLTP
mgnify:CR=1 FL=1